MHDALVGLLDKVDTAVAESAGALDRTEVESVAVLARATRVRLAYPDSIVVVALAGGTGSGKSSLANAIAGEEVALTGGIRPVTSEPLALVPADGAEALDGFLDELGISDRVRHDGPSWLCLIDLPDNDSVELDHRHRVDALLPRVDMVAWVTDPEKYRDAVLHHQYISEMSRYQEQFVFVLNQIDRLDPEDVGVVVSRPRQGTARGRDPRARGHSHRRKPGGGAPLRGGSADRLAGGGAGSSPGRESQGARRPRQRLVPVGGIVFDGPCRRLRESVG